MKYVPWKLALGGMVAVLPCWKLAFAVPQKMFSVSISNYFPTGIGATHSVCARWRDEFFFISNFSFQSVKGLIQSMVFSNRVPFSECQKQNIFETSITILEIVTDVMRRKKKRNLVTFVGIPEFLNRMISRLKANFNNWKCLSLTRHNLTLVIYFYKYSILKIQYWK